MKQAQCKAILKHLRAGEKLTPIDAMNAEDIKSMKLSTRIGEIKRSGVLSKNESILDSWVKLPNDKKVKQYFIVQVGQLNLI